LGIFDVFGDVWFGARLDPLRWSGSLSFDACTAQLEKEKAKKEGGGKKKEEEEKNKLTPPDKAKYNKEIADKNAEIERLQRDMQTIQKKLQEKNQDKDGFYEKKKHLANRMLVYGEQIKKLKN